jgi:AcrR family transcriptional regulator
MGSMGHEEQTEGTSTRLRILQISLALMSQRGVDGTSMRDLAAAAGLNVASLYHYFPSKRDLLEAVLIEHGLFPVQAGRPRPDDEEEAVTDLADLLSQILGTMFEVEDFVRLMLGEAMRGDVTARAVGLDLFTAFEASIEEWILKNRPDLDERSGAPEAARLLSAMIVGVFATRAAGVINDDGDNLTATLTRRAKEAAHILRAFE